MGEIQNCVWKSPLSLWFSIFISLFPLHFSAFSFLYFYFSLSLPFLCVFFLWVETLSHVQIPFSLSLPQIRVETSKRMLLFLYAYRALEISFSCSNPFLSFPHLTAHLHDASHPHRYPLNNLGIETTLPMSSLSSLRKRRCIDTSLF